MNGFVIQCLIGAKLTLLLALNALLLGLVLGLLLALGALCKNKSVQGLSLCLGALIRGLPELIVIFGVYFGSSALLNQCFNHPVQVNAFIAAIVALALIFSAYAAEVFRASFLAIDPGQTQAAYTLGLSRYHTLIHITLPQALKHALPGLSNLWLVLLKDTALVSLIGLADLMNKAHLAASASSDPLRYYTLAALLYMIMTSGSSLLIRFLLTNSKGQRQ
jgi:His/Glu/Gln/Arg/opine family amino acid ABC transporter permease subunit